MSVVPVEYEENAAWERQPNDTDKSFAAFIAYRDIGSDRSMKKAAEAIGVSVMQVREWSSRDGWRWRAGAYDAYIDRMRVRQRVAEVRDMERRHAQVAAAGLAGLMTPFVALGRPRQLGGGLTIPRMDELEALPTSDLVRLAARAAYALTRMVGVERLARGEPTEIVQGQLVEPRAEEPLPDRERILAMIAALQESNLIQIDDGGVVLGDVLDVEEVEEL